MSPWEEKKKLRGQGRKTISEKNIQDLEKLLLSNTTPLTVKEIHATFPNISSKSTNTIYDYFKKIEERNPRSFYKKLRDGKAFYALQPFQIIEHHKQKRYTVYLNVGGDTYLLHEIKIKNRSPFFSLRRGEGVLFPPKILENFSAEDFGEFFAFYLFKYLAAMEAFLKNKILFKNSNSLANRIADFFVDLFFHTLLFCEEISSLNMSEGYIGQIYRTDMTEDEIEQRMWDMDIIAEEIETQDQ